MTLVTTNGREAGQRWLEGRLARSGYGKLPWERQTGGRSDVAAGTGRLEHDSWTAGRKSEREREREHIPVVHCRPQPEILTMIVTRGLPRRERSLSLCSQLYASVQCVCLSLLPGLAATPAWTSGGDIAAHSSHAPAWPDMTFRVRLAACYFLTDGRPPAH